MPNIKWIGIKNELSEYQRGELPENAKKLKMPKTINDMMIQATPFLIFPLVILFLSMYFKTRINRQVVINPIFIFVGLMIGFVALLLHEYLHAIVYPKEAKVYIGIYPKAFAAVALSSYPLKRNRFIVMSLLPTILGLLPILLFLFTPADMKELNGSLFGFSVMGLVSPYGDFYNVYQVIRQTPKNCKIQFLEDDTYWFE